jgi:hypothetical protein
MTVRRPVKYRTNGTVGKILQNSHNSGNFAAIGEVPENYSGATVKCPGKLQLGKHSVYPVRCFSDLLQNQYFSGSIRKKSAAAER